MLMFLLLCTCAAQQVFNDTNNVYGRAVLRVGRLGHRDRERHDAVVDERTDGPRLAAEERWMVVWVKEWVLAL